MLLPYEVMPAEDNAASPEACNSLCLVNAQRWLYSGDVGGTPAG